MSGFNIKTFGDILSDMADWVTSSTSRLTNFFVGSVIRTLLEAVAIEIESMYFKMYDGFKNAIESAIFNSFGFTRTPATAATGSVTFTFKTPLAQMLTIPAGYQVSTMPSNGQSALTFTVSSDFICLAGAQSATVNVQCTQTGTIGNIPANSIRIMVIPINEVLSLTNTQAYTSGQDEETLDSRKKRFSSYIQNLPKGTISALQYACLSVSGVTGAFIDDHIGYTIAYVHDANGQLPDSLKAQVEAAILDYKSAGIDVQVYPVVARSVNLNLTVTIQKGFDTTLYQSMVVNSVTSFLNFFPVSKGLTQAELIKHIMDIDTNAILNVATNMTGDVTVANNELIRAGTINVTIATI